LTAYVGLAGVTVTGMLHSALRGPCGPAPRLLSARVAGVRRP